MFLDVIGTNIEILSVFELSWDKRTAALSDRRPYDAISIRLKGNADFIVGDKKYGNNKKDPLRRLCLHANKLEFMHPTTNKKVEVEVPIPDEFLDLINKKVSKDRY